MNIYIVYWIHRKIHTNILTEGYVGVTGNLLERVQQHLYQKQNQHLKYAFDKYDDIIIDVITLNFLESYCYFIEYLLRSERQIGWNIAIGGGKPPSFEGKIPWNKGKKGCFSEESIEKLKKSRKNKSPNKGTIFSEQWRKNLSKATKGENNPNYGKKHSEETKQLIREKAIGRISPMKGKKFNKKMKDIT